MKHFKKAIAAAMLIGVLALILVSRAFAEGYIYLTYANGGLTTNGVNEGATNYFVTNLNVTSYSNILMYQTNSTWYITFQGLTNTAANTLGNNSNAYLQFAISGDSPAGATNWVTNDPNYLVTLPIVGTNVVTYWTNFTGWNVRWIRPWLIGNQATNIALTNFIIEHMYKFP